jgi:transposase InsO family protein
MYYYKNVRDDSETISKLLEVSEKHPTEGQDLYYSRIRFAGLQWNYKRVRRVYRLLGMNRRRKVRRRVPARIKVPLLVPQRAGQMWSMDFMSDVLISKRKFRTLNIIDDYNREAITVEAAHTMPAIRVTQILERTLAERMNGILKGEFDLYGSSVSFELTYQKIRDSIKAYNELRPHGSCDYLTPSLAHEQTNRLKKRWMKYQSKWQKEKQLNLAAE